MQSSNFIHDENLGSIPSHWNVKILGDVCDVKGRIGWRGYTVEDIRDSGPLVLGATQISSDNRLDLSKPTFISQEKFEESPEIKVDLQDILIVKVGNTIGKVAIVLDDIGNACINPNTVLLKRIKIVPRFLFYHLVNTYAQNFLVANSSASAQPAINQTVLKSMLVPVPPPREQQAIVAILGALDDKIEFNRRMNRTLESLAQASFREWFVDKEESVRWEEKALDEVADFLNGLALQKYPAEEGKYYLPVIKIAQLRKNDTRDADRANTNVPNEYIIKDGDILFSWSGSLEDAIWCGGKGALNQHLFKVTSENYPKWFYYLWTKHHLPEFQAIAAGKATTMGHIQRHHLSDAKVLVPSDRELQEMDKVLSPILDKIICNEKESRTLANLRDILLPKLMRGEVCVRDL